VANRGNLRAPKRGAAPAAANQLGEERSTECRHRRLPVGQATGVGGEQRGYDGGKKVRGRKRHLLVDTEGLVLKAKVHSAKVPDQDGLKLLLDSARTAVSGLKHLWLDAGYEGRGRRWAEVALSLSVEIVRKPKKPVPEKVAMIWAEEWAKEGKEVDWQKLMPPKGFVVLPRRWVVERTFS
jgi:putative transposase